MTRRVLLAVVLFAGICWLYFEVDAARDVIRLHAPAPDAIIRVGNAEMTQLDALCQELLPKLRPAPSRLRRVLVCQHEKRLLPMLYVLAALTGWCASVWLLALQGGQQREPAGSFVASLFLALAVGIIAYLVLLAPVLAFKFDKERLETAVVFPLLGGLFLRMFFDRLPDVLTRFFDLITGKRRAPEEPENAQKEKPS